MWHVVEQGVGVVAAFFMPFDILAVVFGRVVLRLPVVRDSRSCALPDFSLDLRCSMMTLHILHCVVLEFFLSFLPLSWKFLRSRGVSVSPLHRRTSASPSMVSWCHQLLSVVSEVCSAHLLRWSSWTWIACFVSVALGRVFGRSF